MLFSLIHRHFPADKGTQHITCPMFHPHFDHDNRYVNLADVTGKSRVPIARAPVILDTTAATTDTKGNPE